MKNFSQRCGMAFNGKNNMMMGLSLKEGSWNPKPNREARRLAKKLNKRSKRK